MNYHGYIVVDRETGAIVGGYPRPGTAAYHTRLGEWDGTGPLASHYEVIKVEGAA